MTAAPAARTSSSALGAEATAEESALHTVRRGLALTPNALQGLWITILLAVIATAGKVVVPIAVQSILDRGIIEPATPDLAFVSGAAALAALVLLSTAATARTAVTSMASSVSSTPVLWCGSSKTQKAGDSECREHRDYAILCFE